MRRAAAQREIERPDWMEGGRCLGSPTDVFFPGAGRSLAPAIELCAECDVREACLEYALEHGIEHGVWGGRSERARRLLARDRRLAGAAPPTL